MVFDHCVNDTRATSHQLHSVVVDSSSSSQRSLSPPTMSTKSGIINSSRICPSLHPLSEASYILYNFAEEAEMSEISGLLSEIASHDKLSSSRIVSMRARMPPPFAQGSGIFSLRRYRHSAWVRWQQRYSFTIVYHRSMSCWAMPTSSGIMNRSRIFSMRTPPLGG